MSLWPDAFSKEVLPLAVHWVMWMLGVWIKYVSPPLSFCQSQGPLKRILLPSLKLRFLGTSSYFFKVVNVVVRIMKYPVKNRQIDLCCVDCCPLYEFRGDRENWNETHHHFNSGGFLVIGLWRIKTFLPAFLYFQIPRVNMCYML